MFPLFIILLIVLFPVSLSIIRRVKGKPLDISLSFTKRGYHWRATASADGVDRTTGWHETLWGTKLGLYLWAIPILKKDIRAKRLQKPYGDHASTYKITRRV